MLWLIYFCHVVCLATVLLTLCDAVHSFLFLKQPEDWTRRCTYCAPTMSIFQDANTKILQAQYVRYWPIHTYKLFLMLTEPIFQKLSLVNLGIGIMEYMHVYIFQHGCKHITHCNNDLILNSSAFVYLFIYIYIIYTLKNAGLNTTQRWVKYGWTQRLGCLDPVVGLLPRRLG